MQAVDKGEVSTTVNSEKQLRHIKVSEQYIQRRSYIYGDIDRAQELVNRLYGTGESVMVNGVWQHKERVIADTIIGVHVDPATGAETPTN